MDFHTTKSNVQDGSWYDLELQYDALSDLLSVYVDNSFRHSITLDIKEDIFNGESQAYWGMLGSTGGVSNKQQVCFDWDTTEQNGDTKYVMPTVFMPNGDNLDDEFLIFTKDGYTIGKMWIYNRWGELMYEGTDPWDGTYKSENAKQGVYVVAAELISDSGELTKIVGDVTLLR